MVTPKPLKRVVAVSNVKSVSSPRFWDTSAQYNQSRPARLSDPISIKQDLDPDINEKYNLPDHQSSRNGIESTPIQAAKRPNISRMPILKSPIPYCPPKSEKLRVPIPPRWIREAIRDGCLEHMERGFARVDLGHLDSKENQTIMQATGQESTVTPAELPTKPKDGAKGKVRNELPSRRPLASDDRLRHTVSHPLAPRLPLRAIQPADLDLTREEFEARLPSDEFWQDGKDTHEDLLSLDERSEHPDSSSLPKHDHENNQTQDQKASMEVMAPNPTESKTVRSFIDIALRISPSSAQLLSSFRTKVLATLPDLEAQPISKLPLLNQIGSSLNNISLYCDSLAIYARHHAAFPFTIGKPFAHRKSSGVHNIAYDASSPTISKLRTDLCLAFPSEETSVDEQGNSFGAPKWNHKVWRAQIHLSRCLGEETAKELKLRAEAARQEVLKGQGEGEVTVQATGICYRVFRAGKAFLGNDSEDGWVELPFLGTKLPLDEQVPFSDAQKDAVKPLRALQLENNDTVPSPTINAENPPPQKQEREKSNKKERRKERRDARERKREEEKERKRERKKLKKLRKRPDFYIRNYVSKYSYPDEGILTPLEIDLAKLAGKMDPESQGQGEGVRAGRKSSSVDSADADVDANVDRKLELALKKRWDGVARAARVENENKNKNRGGVRITRYLIGDVDTDTDGGDRPGDSHTFKQHRLHHHHHHLEPASIPTSTFPEEATPTQREEAHVQKLVQETSLRSSTSTSDPDFKWYKTVEAEIKLSFKQAREARWNRRRYRNERRASRRKMLEESGDEGGW